MKTPNEIIEKVLKEQTYSTTIADIITENIIEALEDEGYLLVYGPTFNETV